MDSYDYECAYCPFTSGGWATKKARDARGRQHENEHKTAKAMQAVGEFEESLTR